MRRSANPLGIGLTSMALLISTVGAGQWQALRDISGTATVDVLVKGKSRSYVRLTADAPLSLTVQGPGRLRIVSRAELPPGGGQVVSYRVRVAEAGAVLREQTTESSPASKASLKGQESVICKSRTFTVEIPDGAHSIVLTPSGTPSVLVRLLFSGPRSKEMPMVSLTPVEAARSVTVSEGEKLIPYYSVLSGKPVRLRVVGPTTLELTARLDFDASMRGAQTYRLGISSDGRHLRTVEFRTTKSLTANYTDLKNRVASKLGRVVLPVGNGTHDMSVELIAPKKGSAEIHARISQPSVGNEE